MADATRSVKQTTTGELVDSCLAWQRPASRRVLIREMPWSDPAVARFGAHAGRAGLSPAGISDG